MKKGNKKYFFVTIITSCDWFNNIYRTFKCFEIRGVFMDNGFTKG